MDVDVDGHDHGALLRAFDEARSEESAEDFVHEVLIRCLDARVVVVGEDFHFGHARAGNVALLRKLGEELGIQRELNAANDNPLVSVADQTLISNGNFHPMVLAIAFDALRVAIAHVGQISERRMSHLWDAFFGRLAEGGVPSTGGGSPQLVGLALRYPAAAVISELTQLAATATLDTPPLDIGVEDHATGAPLSVRKTHEALDLLDDILAIEVLLAGDVLRALPTLPSLGSGTPPVMAMATELVTAPGRRSPDDIHRALRAGFPRH